MRPRSPLALVLLLLAAACGVQNSEQSATDPAVDRAAVERSITVWFDSGIAVQDTNVVRNGVADDVAILEDTVWYDKNGIIAFVANLESVFGGPFTLRYTLSDWRTVVEGDVAYTTFRNRAVATPANGAAIPMHWLETAVLRRSGDKWLIVRYQSATVK
jgi:ketosteroid isomerase-like protein